MILYPGSFLRSALPADPLPGHIDNPDDPSSIQDIFYPLPWRVCYIYILNLILVASLDVPSFAQSSAPLAPLLTKRAMTFVPVSTILRRSRLIRRSWSFVVIRKCKSAIDSQIIIDGKSPPVPILLLIFHSHKSSHMGRKQGYLGYAKSPSTKEFYARRNPKFNDMCYICDGD